jgi:hypothetical protein
MSNCYVLDACLSLADSLGAIALSADRNLADF